MALVPARYSGTAREGDAALQLARKTEWLEIGPEHYRGLGQRMLHDQRIRGRAARGARDRPAIRAAAETT